MTISYLQFKRAAGGIPFNCVISLLYSSTEIKMVVILNAWTYEHRDPFKDGCTQLMNVACQALSRLYLIPNMLSQKKKNEAAFFV
uniref:Uncharacterized protein n=1 Tax=Anguilla anguilla TaxID=7936 RepID=A0A0E9S5U1_ANGAN